MSFFSRFRKKGSEKALPPDQMSYAPEGQPFESPHLNVYPIRREPSFAEAGYAETGYAETGYVEAARAHGAQPPPPAGRDNTPYAHYPSDYPAQLPHSEAQTRGAPHDPSPFYVPSDQAYLEAVHAKGSPTYKRYILGIGILILASILGWVLFRSLFTAPTSTPIEITAPDGPFKVRPEDPGGMEIPHQDMYVYDRMDPHAQPQPEEHFSEDPETLVTFDALEEGEDDAYYPPQVPYPGEVSTSAPSQYAPQPQATYSPQPQSYVPRPQSYVPQQQAYVPAPPAQASGYGPPGYAPPPLYAQQPPPPAPSRAPSLREEPTDNIYLPLPERPLQERPLQERPLQERPLQERLQRQVHDQIPSEPAAIYRAPPAQRPARQRQADPREMDRLIEQQFQDTSLPSGMYQPAAVPRRTRDHRR